MNESAISSCRPAAASAASASSEPSLVHEGGDQWTVRHAGDAVSGLPGGVDRAARVAFGLCQRAAVEVEQRAHAGVPGEADDRAAPAHIGERLLDRALGQLEVPADDQGEDGVDDEPGVAGLLGDESAVYRSCRERDRVRCRTAVDRVLLRQRRQQHSLARRLPRDRVREARDPLAGHRQRVGYEASRANQLGLHAPPELRIDRAHRLNRFLQHPDGLDVAPGCDQPKRKVVRHLRAAPGIGGRRQGLAEVLDGFVGKRGPDLGLAQFCEQLRTQLRCGWLVECARQVAHRRFRRAPVDRARGGVCEHSDGPGVTAGDRGEQVWRDALGVNAVVVQQARRGDVARGQLRGRDTLVDGAAHERVHELERTTGREHLRSHQRVSGGRRAALPSRRARAPGAARRWFRAPRPRG